MTSLANRFNSSLDDEVSGYMATNVFLLSAETKVDIGAVRRNKSHLQGDIRITTDPSAPSIIKELSEQTRL